MCSLTTPVKNPIIMKINNRTDIAIRHFNLRNNTTESGLGPNKYFKPVNKLYKITKNTTMMKIFTSIITSYKMTNESKIMNYSFIFTTLFSLVFFILFVKLSCWQFSRASEKLDILQKTNSLNNTLILTEQNIKTINKLPEYTHVKLEGVWDNARTILLSNQFYNHAVGYNIITPFITDNYGILVNRGWIAKNNLKNLKKILSDSQNNTITLTAISRLSNTSQYIMGDNISINTDHTELQKLDITNPDLIKLFPYTLSNIYLQLLTTSEQKPVFVTDWQWTNISPDKHKAYALQWLTLAITTVLLYSYFCYKTLK